MQTATLFFCLLLSGSTSSLAEDLFSRGESVDLGSVIPANERGILCLAADEQGRLVGGTTGRAAHLFLHDPAMRQTLSLVRLEGGVGFAYALARLPDGSWVGGTQADPTGIAVCTDPKAVGRLYQFVPASDGTLRAVDLGVAVPGQGIYTLVYIAKSNEIVGNTWPDGHFFTYNLKTKQYHDHGAIAGYRTYETPRQAEEVSRATGKKVSYPRQVSRSIALDPRSGAAWTAGANGFLYRYDPESRKLEKQNLQLPAAAGRAAWTSLDAALIYARTSHEEGDYSCLLGGTSDGYLMELRIFDKGNFQLRSRGKALAQPGVQSMVMPHAPGTPEKARATWGVGGTADGMPRSFYFSHGGSTSTVLPGGIPRVDGRPSMVGFGALVSDGKGSVWAGECDRLGRLVRYWIEPEPTKPAKAARGKPANPQAATAADNPPRLDCHIVFAPEGTTTDGSGYTAIEVGKDGRVYVGSARYGHYGWLLRFDPVAKPLFMDKVVSMQQLTGEWLQGIHTQAKIHAKIVIGADGRVWFASKQGHEVFDTRPEYDEPNGYPGGHLCYFDPKTGLSRSVGILKTREGLQGGALDEARGKLYFRSEPKDHLLVYDVATGDVKDRGHLGAACRYMAVDSRGAVWTVGRGQSLCRYDPETGYVEEVAIRVEGEGGYRPPYVIALGPDGRLLGGVTGHPWLMRFDIDHYQPGPFPTVPMRNIAPAAPPGLPVQDIHAGVFGKDGRFYYPLNTTGTDVGNKPKAHLRIMRYDPKTQQTETVGVPHVVGLDEAKVRHVYTRGDKYGLEHMQGAAVGPDGSLYLLDIYPQLNVACFPKLTAPK